MDYADLLVRVASVALLMAGVAVALWVYLSVPVIALRNAGYPGWLAIPFILTFPISGVVFALARWPIYREIAWLRMKAGDTPEPDVDLIEQYAVDLERDGEWAKAVEVYEELAARTPTEESRGYYQNSADRLRQGLKQGGDA
jgi:hypothetical protein